MTLLVQKPRVLHVSDNASRLGGGIFESMLGLCRGLKQDGGWEPTLLSLFDRHSLDDASAWSSTPVRLLQPGLHPLLFGTRRLAREISRSKVDVVHLHGIWGPASLAIASADIKNATLVVTPHGMLEPWALERSRFKKWVAWKAWMGSLLNRTTIFHALCEEEKISINKLLPGARVAVVPNGIDLPVSEKSGIREKEILFIGRINPKKGLLQLVEAWAMCSAIRSEGWKLVICGWDDGGHEAQLRSRVRELQIESNLIFHGPAYGDDKVKLFRRASAFILPSFSEGLPMAILEAWSFELPTLMTSECHLNDGFEAHAAIRIDPAPTQIADGLKRFVSMSQNERAAMGMNGHSLVASRFTWRAVTEKIISVYNDNRDTHPQSPVPAYRRVPSPNL